MAILWPSNVTSYDVGRPTPPPVHLSRDRGRPNGTHNASLEQGNIDLEGVYRLKDVETATLVVIMLASLVANCMVFYIFYRKPSLMTISNRFVLNLTICNFLITVLLMPFVLASTRTEEWALGSVYCSITGVLSTLLFTACVFTLLLISLDRYHAITKPFRYSSIITSSRATLFTVLVWLLSSAIAIPPVFGLGFISYQPDKSLCAVEWSSAAIKDRSYAFGIVILCFLLPLILMVWVYATIFRAVQRSSALARINSVVTDLSDPHMTQQMLAHAQNASQQRRRSSMASLVTQINAFRRRSSIGNRSILSLHRGDQKAAKTGMMVLSTFLVCWLPFFIVITLEAATGLPDIVPHWIQVTSIWMIFTGCSLNPIVYVFRSRSIEQELLTVLRLKTAGGRHSLSGAENNGCVREREKGLLRENGYSCPARLAQYNSDGPFRPCLTPNYSTATFLIPPAGNTRSENGAPVIRTASTVAFSIAPPSER